MRRSSRDVPDAFDLFVAQAVRSFATGEHAPELPAGELWVDRAIEAGVLSAVLTGQAEAGRPLPVRVSTVRAQAAARHLRHLQDLRWLGGVLDASGVAWAALKGPILRGVIFERPHGRDYTDLDVLVPPHQIRAATKHLLDAGASLMDQDWGSALRARTAEVALVLPHGSVLDLHWSLFNLASVREGYRLTTADLMDRRETVEVDGVRTRTLHRVDLVMHVLLHASQSGGHKLRWPLDVQQSLRWLGDDVDGLRVRVRSLGVRAPARAAVDLAQQHVDANVDPQRATGPPTAWTRMLKRRSQAHPPSTPSLKLTGAQAWYSCTRGSSGSIAAALLTEAAMHLRYRRSGWPEPVPAPAAFADVGFQRWLGMAETRGR